jgi:hypothetical protein
MAAAPGLRCLDCGLHGQPGGVVLHRDHGGDDTVIAGHSQQLVTQAGALTDAELVELRREAREHHGRDARSQHVLQHLAEACLVDGAVDCERHLQHRADPVQRRRVGECAVLCHQSRSFATTSISTRMS